jgi:hypothetical protein
MRRAVVPVYERIERDPQTRASIRQIRALKRTMPGEAVIPIPPTCRWNGSG